MPEDTLSDLLDFDKEEEIQIATVPNRSEVEEIQTKKLTEYRLWKEVILTPEVARCIRDGWTDEEIAGVLGCHPDTVRKHRQSRDVITLLEAEQRRLLNHLATRDLKEEKYRDLVVSLGVLNDKGRQIRNEPEDGKHTDSTTEILDRVADILWGPGRRRQGHPVIDVSADAEPRALPGVHERNEQEGSEKDGGSP